MAAITQKDWGRIHAKAWSDPAFAKAFEADPRAAIKKYGAELDIDPDADFRFQDRPDHISDASAKAMAEGTEAPEPMYCC